MKEFIEKELTDMLKTYHDKPIRISSDYGREIATIGDYKGRELLELIQNADDALNTNCEQKVKVSFKNNILKVSNNGDAFTEKGVSSLMYSNVSPKMQNSLETIGCKGLGFRSILSWADTINIDSDSLHITFSEKISQDQLKHSLGEKYNKEMKSATLALPKWNADFEADDFTTTITIKVKDSEDVVSDIKNQLNRLKPETLLFLNKIQKLEINDEEKETIIEKIDIDDKNVKLIVKKNGRLYSTSEWVVVKETGTIKQKEEEKQYLISFAYRKDGQLVRNSVIYSFFPTRISFPFPILFNASFELSSNRNEIKLNENSNKVIFKKAAKLLIETAIEMYKGKPDYKILWFLLSNLNFPKESTLNEYNFEELIMDELGNYNVFPNVNKQYLKYSQKLVLGKYGYARYVFGDQFNKLLMHYDMQTIKHFYSEDDLELKYSIFDEKMNDIEFSSFNLSDLYKMTSLWVKELKYQNRNDMLHLAKTLVSLYKIKAHGGYVYFYGAPTNEFLYTSEGKNPENNSTIFLKEDDSVTNPPSFNNCSLMAPYLADAMVKELNANEDEKEEIRKWLNISLFDIEEIVSVNNDLIENESYENDDDAKAHQMAGEQLKWLWVNRKQIFKLEGVLSAYLPTMDGTYGESDNLYMGASYGNSFIEELFPNSQELMVCSLSEFIKKDIKIEESIKFLKKLGVAIEPKKSTEIEDVRYSANSSTIKNMYFNSIVNNLDFTNTYKIKGTTQEYKSVGEARVHLRFDAPTTKIAKLDSILKSASTRTIIDWVLSDKSLQSLLFDKHEETASGKVKMYYDSNKTPREDSKLNKHTSYIYLQFQNNEWIEHGDNVYYPKECFLNEEYNELFDEAVACININNYKKETDSKRDIENVKNVFKQLGVTDKLDMLPSETIYDVLLNLKDRDPNGKYAPFVYEKLVRSEHFYKNIKKGKKYNEFIENGLIFTNHGYQKIKESHYEGKKKLCSAIEDMYSFISINGSRGISKERIKKIFELDKPDTKANIKNIIKDEILSPSFENDFKKFKYYIYSYKYTENQDDDDPKKLFNLNITLCSKAVASHKGQEFELNDYEYLKKDRNTYLLKAPNNLSPTTYKGDYHFVEAISGIICEHLNIESDDVEDTLSTIYIRDENGRAEKLSKDFNNNAYNVARKVLNSFYGTKYDFLEIIKTISKVNQAEYITYVDKINFDEFDDPNSIKNVIDCFKHAKIDVEEYNKENPEIKLDLTGYYKNIINNSLHRYENQYRTKCYLQLLNESLDKKETLCDDLDDFNTINIVPQNSVYFDVDKEIVKTLGIEDIKESINIEDIYTNSKKNWIQNIEDTSEAEDFLNDYSNHSLMIYNESEELYKRYEERLKKIKVKEAEERKEELKKKRSTSVKQGEISVIKKSQNQQEPQKQSKNNFGFKKQQISEEINEEVGFLGEKYVYEELKKNHEYVKWVSENAQREGINSEGRAGLGYDIEYEDENNVIRYVEVKTTKRKSSSIDFSMSENEYSFAVTHFSNFSIWYVSLLDDVAEIVKFDSIFTNDGAIKEINERKEVKYFFNISIKE